MDTMQFNNIQDPIARAEAMRAQAVSQMFVDAIEGLSKLVKGAAASFAAYLRYRRNYDALAAMTDHELDDIGITRADIAAVARGIDPRKQRRTGSGDIVTQRLALAEAFGTETESDVPANQDRRDRAAAA